MKGNKIAQDNLRTSRLTPIEDPPKNSVSNGSLSSNQEEDALCINGVSREASASSNFQLGSTERVISRNNTDHAASTLSVRPILASPTQIEPNTNL